jgi:small-conductance mechanosensitive channel
MVRLRDRGRTLMICIRRIVMILMFALCGGAALAQETATPATPEKAAATVTLDNADSLFTKWEQDAQAIDERLQSQDVTAELLSEIRAILDPHRVNARALAEQARTQLAPLVAQSEALGPPPEDTASEDKALSDERADINKRLAALRAVVSKSDLAFTRADRLIATATDAQRQRFTDQLLQRGPAPIDPRHWIRTGIGLAAVGQKVVSEATTAEARSRRHETWQDTGPSAIAALVFALVLLVFVRRYALSYLSHAIRRRPASEINAETEMSAFGGLDAHATLDGANASVEGVPEPYLGPPPSRARRLAVGIGVTLTRLLIPLAALLAARYALDTMQLLGPTGRVVVDETSRGLLVIAVTYALSFAFFAPRTPDLRLSGFDDRTARRASFYAMTIAVALALNIGLVGAGEQLGLSVSTLAVMNLCTVLLAAWGLWQMGGIWGQTTYLTKSPVDGEDGASGEDNWFAENLIVTGRRAAYLLAVVTPLAAVAGYYALSRYLLQAGILSAAVIAVAVVLFLAAREASEALYEASDDGRDAAEGGETGESVGLFPVVIGFMLALATIPVLALVWGATTGDLREAYFGLTEGFSVGDTVFRPGDILIAALVFALGLFLTRILQSVVRRAVMPRTKLDVGARSSIVSGLGYLGFFIAALTAISYGGLDLTNLAFLGAALGVGIGFGLQNIVNNFVSGIILLIERPIKIGDWIEVASIHGTVSKINVRSTEIQTFDRASYIVPNSELISGAVTNYTHDNVMGRVICPVGVGDRPGASDDPAPTRAAGGVSGVWRQLAGFRAASLPARCDVGGGDTLGYEFRDRTAVR